ncbi:hypothetical protein, partial [Brucella cytisi]|uniref:hypothetical protein n=1 Tax=Brucella cytisi TaxID=407152 RepID=UPI0035BC4133
APTNAGSKSDEATANNQGTFLVRQCASHPDCRAIAIAFIAGLKRPSFSLFLLPIALICAWGQVDELHDPFVGPAIRAELGGAYFTHGYLSAIAGIVGPLIVWAVIRLYRVRAKH